MATVQSYTKTGVDNKVASRSNVTLAYSGTGTPELTAFPDAKTGDIIERSSDRAQWRVLGNTLVSLGHIVTKVNGQTGEVNITAAGLNASPTGHTHTKSNITDLETISTTATANHVVKRTTGGNITVPTTPNANTSAASKSYVDSQVSTKANASHTHTKSQITDLETISTTATADHVVKRITAGNITVPTTPNATTSATSKSYVDTEVGKKANTSHTHTKSQITDLETISTNATANHVVKRTTGGNITVPTTPNANTSAASKSYVDSKLGDMAGAAHTHTKSDITDLEMVSTGATGNHIVKRNTDGNITVPATPAATTSATSKSYVDTEVGKKANTSHTHTISQITDLTVSTGTTVNHVVKRTTSGNITVPTTPNANTSAASKAYVDTEVGKKANTSHTHKSADISDAYHYIGSAATADRVVKTYSNGHIYVSEDPPGPDAVPRRKYVDEKVAGHTLTNSQLPVAEYIPPESDLDDYLNTGVYIQIRDADAQSGFNYPPAAINAGLLEVIAYGAFTYQRYTEYRRGRVFSRLKYINSWRAWIELLDDTDATAIVGSNSYGKIVRREADSDAIRVGEPTASYHAARKSYVDTEVGKKANTSHTHTSEDIRGARTLIGRSTDSNAIVKTDDSGWFYLGNDPTHGSHPTRKGYVDAEVRKKADSSHTHTISQITDLTVSTAATVNHVVKRTTSGNITVPTTPNANTSAVSKSYVDSAIPWSGTSTQYNAITTKDPNRLYIITGA